MENQHTHKKESQRARRENARPPGSSLANILQTKQTTSLRSQSTLVFRLTQDTSCTRRVPDGLVFSPRKLVAPTHSPEQPALRVPRVLFRQGLGVCSCQTPAPTVRTKLCCSDTQPRYSRRRRSVRTGSVNARQPVRVCLRKVGASASLHSGNHSLGGKVSHQQANSFGHPSAKPPPTPPASIYGLSCQIRSCSLPTAGKLQRGRAPVIGPGNLLKSKGRPDWSGSN